MNNIESVSIEQLATEAHTAQTNFNKIESVIADKQAALAEAKEERARLQSLILTGDTEAMTGIVDARALIEGLEDHLKELGEARSNSAQSLLQANAHHQQARAEGLDVQGLMTNAEITSTWEEIKNTVDGAVHPFLDRLKAHENALQELGKLIDDSNRLLGTHRNHAHRDGTSFSARYLSASVVDQSPIMPVHVPQDFNKAVAKSMQRHGEEVLAEAVKAQRAVDQEINEMQKKELEDYVRIGDTRA